MNASPPSGIDPSSLEWFKSTASSDTGACVEMAWVPDGWVALRDSKNPEQVALVTALGWSCFLNGARTGEFDCPA
jgi:hypothetical protein